jgi:hypothetical protein
LSAAHTENHRLQAENQALQQELDQITNRLQASETRLCEIATENERIARRDSERQSELVELKKQLHASQEMSEALRTEQKQLDDIKSENWRLEKEIAGLRSRLDLSERQLVESARQNQQTADAYARLQIDFACLEQQVKEGQAKTGELAAAQQILANFESRERFLNERNRELEAQLVHLQRELSARMAVGSAIATEGAREDKKAPVLRRRPRRNRSFGIVPACVVCAIVSAIAVGFLSVGPKDLSGIKEPAVASVLVTDEPSISVQAASAKPKLAPPAKTKPASTTFQRKNPIQAPQPEPRLRGTFKTIQPTEVYNGPSENAALIASIPAGIKINVIDSRHGWLEIRSKHGRPPGFVRQEAAVRAAQS